MRTKGREQGRFVALSGFRKVAGPSGGCYELLIVDGEGKPVSPLCEWFRLRKQPGSNGTRRTYLNFLQPFFAYLFSHDYAWNAEPSQIRSYVKAFLLEDLRCSVSPDRVLDGYRITLTGSSPLSASGLRVLLAALRDFYTVMAEAGLYGYANPMCSQMLQCWKRERMKAIVNTGAPDHAGIRSESWHETNLQPTAFFRLRRRDVWKPDVTLTSEQIQQRMNTDLDWMVRHASTQRERKRTRTACPDTVSPHDPLLAYKKPDLVARLRQVQARCAELEAQQATMLQDYVQKDVRIAELEAELARYREYFEGLRLQVQQQEHGG